MNKQLSDKIYGCLLGGVIGDSMGGPSEGMTWKEIKEKFGWIDSFEGCGTDDTVIKLILTDAIFHNEGYVTADEWAEAFLEREYQYYPLYYAPVRNMFHKLQYESTLPVYAGCGNSPSSSSAMAISPMGIINACDPRRASAETYDVAGMVHQGEATFCRDGACAVAAAIAEALKAEATVGSIAEASYAYLHRKSSREMSRQIQEALDVAWTGKDYEAFRNWYYENKLQIVFCDSRETIPAAIALFALADGDFAKTAEYSANFGRDADTIGTIAVSIAGAYCGASGIPGGWIEQLEKYFGTVQRISSNTEEYGGLKILVPDYRDLTEKFLQVIKKRSEDQLRILEMIQKQVD